MKYEESQYSSNRASPSRHSLGLSCESVSFATSAYFDSTIEINRVVRVKQQPIANNPCSSRSFRSWILFSIIDTVLPCSGAVIVIVLSEATEQGLEIIHSQELWFTKGFSLLAVELNLSDSNQIRVVINGFCPFSLPPPYQTDWVDRALRAEQRSSSLG